MFRFLVAFCAAGHLFSVQGFFDTRYHFNKGIGYETGYTTVELFALQPINQSLYALGDFRTHFLNQGETAVNAGFGLRYGTAMSRYVYGGHVYYDYRKFSGQSFNQISGGLEALGECFDVRFEGYAPLNSPLVACGKKTFDHFEGHHAFLTQEFQAALPFLSGEVAYRFCLPKCAQNNLFSLPGVCGVASLSPYYLFDREVKGISFGGAVGLQGRLKLCFSDLFYAEGIVTHDRIYKTLAQGVIGLSFPFGKGHRCVPCRDLRMIQRQEIIPLQKKSQEALFVNKTTCEPYQFVFVNEDLFGTGAGTYEKPYTRLSVASLYSKPNDIFLVTPSEQGLLEEVTLKKGQKLWATTGENLLGEIIIPGMTSFQRRLASVQTFITLTEDNEVSGFYFSGTGNETGLYSDNLKGHHKISHCVFENLKKGIDLTVGEKASVSLFDNTFDSIVEEALLVTNDGGTISLTAKNNLFSNASIGMSFNLLGDTYLSLSNNQMQNISDNGILLTQSNSLLKAEIFKNRIEANGIPLLMSYEQGKILIKDNILTSLTERVLDINAQGGTLGILNNRLFGISGFEVLYLRRVGGDLLVADIYKNHFLATDFTDKFYMQDNSSIISNWGDASLFELKVEDPDLGQESLNDQNFGEISAENVEYIRR